MLEMKPHSRKPFAATTCKLWVTISWMWCLLRSLVISSQLNSTIAWSHSHKVNHFCVAPFVRTMFCFKFDHGLRFDKFQNIASSIIFTKSWRHGSRWVNKFGIALENEYLSWLSPQYILFPDVTAPLNLYYTWTRIYGLENVIAHLCVWNEH